MSPLSSVCLPGVSLVLALAACASGPARNLPRAPQSAEVLEPVHALVTPNGVHAVVPLRQGESARLGPGTVISLMDRAGQERTRLDDPGLIAACTLVPWGTHAFAVCPPGGGPSPVELLTTPGDPRVRAVRVGAAPEGFIPGHDERTLTVRGPCAPNPAGADAGQPAAITACTASPGRPWRDWQIPGVHGDVLDVYDGQALVTMASHEDPAAVDVRLYDIDAARWLPLELPDTTAAWVRAGFSREGRVVGLLRTGTRANPRGWFVTGIPGQRLDVVPLDDVADDVGVIDRRRAVFTFGNRAEVTDDGGASFRPVTVDRHGVDGHGVDRHLGAVSVHNPSTAPTGQGARRAGGRVVCGEDVCVLDGTVVVPLSLPSSADPVRGG